MSTEGDHYQAARRRVAHMKEFYAHLLVYVVVNAGLLLIDGLSAGDTWVHWPLLGWGVGLAAHWATVFGPARRFGADWEQRKIQQLLERDLSRN